MGKKIVSCIAAFLFAGLCFAGQISIQIVQHNGALDYVSEQSLIVEDELMNGFFDKGFIVTNSVAQVSDSEENDSDLFHSGFGEAFDGASDYFVQVKLFYDSASNKGTKDGTQCRLDHIDWVILKVASGEIIKTSSVRGSEKRPGSDENIRLSTASLIKDIQKAL